ncbi:MAG: hypothetical protein WC291_11635 [Thermodesulfovibrionales bacterium]|jgi:FtsZ-binding cell division protein ZapB
MSALEYADSERRFEYNRAEALRDQVHQLTQDLLKLQHAYDLLRVERDQLLAQKDVYHDRIGNLAIKNAVLRLENIKLRGSP